MKTMQIAKQELNGRELNVLVSLINQVIECTCNEFGYTEDALTPDGMTRNQFKGYVSDLAKKGYITSPDSDWSGQYKMLVSDCFE